MSKRLKTKGWFSDSDGLPTIYKNKDADLFYDITITIAGTSIATGPTWTSDGATVSNDSSVLTGQTLVMTVQIKDTGRAFVTLTDNLGNEEKIIFKWLGNDDDRRQDYHCR